MCHNCPGGDNPLCVNPDHLWLGSVAENLQDAIAKGWDGNVGDSNPSRRFPERLTRGEAHHSAVLTVEQVVEIRKRFRPGAARDPQAVSKAMLAADYGVTVHTIKKLLRGRSWKHVNA